MAKEEKDEKVKLIPFTKELEEAIETDAKRCRRSFVRQVEAVLTAYYGIEDVDISDQKLEVVGELFRTSKKRLPVIEAAIDTDADTKKKKRA